MKNNSREVESQGKIRKGRRGKRKTEEGGEQERMMKVGEGWEEGPVIVWEIGYSASATLLTVKEMGKLAKRPRMRLDDYMPHLEQLRMSVQDRELTDTNTDNQTFSPLHHCPCQPPTASQAHNRFAKSASSMSFSCGAAYTVCSTTRRVHLINYTHMSTKLKHFWQMLTSNIHNTKLCKSYGVLN